LDIVIPLAASLIDLLGIWVTLKTGGMLYVFITSMLVLFVGATMFAFPTLTSTIGDATFSSSDTQLFALCMFILTIFSVTVLRKENRSNPHY
jgi:hypothetical protein